MHKFYTSNLEVKATKDEDRTVEFVASKEVVDRDGEILKIKGIDLKEYKKNPVVLWAHDSRSLPIGKTIKVTKSGDEMRMKVQFAKPEEFGFADTVFKLIKAGYLKAVSIGFLPDFDSIEYPKDKKRGKRVFRIFHKAQLLELSVVPVPANQDALATGKSIKDAVKEEVIDDVEYQEWELFSKDFKYEEKELPTNFDDEETLDEFDLQEEVKELKETTTEIKSYLDEIFKNFKQDASAHAKEEPNAEDYSDEDMQEIYDYFMSEDDTEEN